MAESSQLAEIRVIQGGMGSGVSGWPLARAVSLSGQLGVVAGSGLDAILTRRLQDGDPTGDLRRALEHFPVPAVAREVLERWFRPEGRAPQEPYRVPPLDGLARNPARQRLIAVAAFVEIWLAKEGHDRPVGLNLLTKIPMPNLASLYGAMLAGVDVVLMGAGIPRDIPAALDELAEQRRAALRMEVEGLRPEDAPFFELDPVALGLAVDRSLRRPAFLPIVASNLLATLLARKSSGRVDGLVIEAHSAGGHVAPPRGESRTNERGEPVYGERDVVDFERVAALGLPFWLAGGQGWPGRLQAARDAGAAGVQVGTLFAWCEESGLMPQLKRQVIDLALADRIDVVTDSRASPTGFPFKVARVPGTLSEPDVHASRDRVCDLGYLRTAHARADGTLVFRCPAEPLAQHLAKGGSVEDAEGRKCLCNALLANVGVGQVRAGGVRELPLLTSGDDLRHLGRFLAGRRTYAAADVLRHVMA